MSPNDRGGVQNPIDQSLVRLVATANETKVTYPMQDSEGNHAIRLLSDNRMTLVELHGLVLCLDHAQLLIYSILRDQ